MTIRIKTKDGRVFDVDKKIILRSKVLKDLIEDVGKEEAENKVPFPLIHVSARALEKIIIWCHRCGEASEENNSLYLTAWDRIFFFSMESETLVDLMIAADYLDIPGLSAKGSQFYASVLTWNSTEDLRRIFGIKCDLPTDGLQRINEEIKYIRRM